MRVKQTFNLRKAGEGVDTKQWEKGVAYTKKKEEEAKLSKKDGDKKSKAKSAKKAAATEIKQKQPETQAVKRDDKLGSGQPRSDRGRGGRGRELRENDGQRPPRRQGPRDNRDFKGDENVPPEFRDRGDGGNRRERGEGGFERRGRGASRGGRGAPRGRGGPRPESGRGGFGGFEDRRKFDRHSGNDRTGVKSVDKRDGSGTHNWGSYKDDVEEGSSPPAPTAGEDGEFPASPEATENADLNESGEAAVKEEDDEAKEMTLDEWKAAQKQSKLKQTFNLRKAGEGVDSKQWEKGVAYTKKKDDDEYEDESESEDEDIGHGHKKNLVTDIRITFADNPRRGGGRGRGGRGGRGGPREGGRGGPRGGGRGGFGERSERSDRPPRGSRESAPRMDDETDFPSLIKSKA